MLLRKLLFPVKAVTFVWRFAVLAGHAQRIWRAVVTGEVDLLIVFHNSRQWIPGLFAGLRQVSIPITAYFLDNASTDGTPDLLADRSAVASLSRAYVLRSIHNNGFARGMNLLAAQSRAEFMFLLNPDTRAGKRLPGNACWPARVRTPESGFAKPGSRRASIRKPGTASTGETSWCSGAAALDSAKGVR